MAQKGVSGMGSSNMFFFKTKPCLFDLTLKSLSNLCINLRSSGNSHHVRVLFKQP